MTAVHKQSVASGWHGEINIDFEYRKAVSKTVMASVSHKGPLRVQRPFYPEGEVCHLYLLHPPGGVVGGDTLKINVQSAEHAQAFVTTPGSTKFYRSAGSLATLEQTLSIKKDGLLEWFPQENIFFPGAKTKLKTEIHLQAGANFSGWEINCLGRPVNNEKFTHGEVDAGFYLYREGEIFFVDRLKVNTEKQLSASAGLRGYAMNALFICTGCKEAEVEAARGIINQLSVDFPVGITLLDDVLVLRALANQSEKLQAVIIPVWQALRHSVFNLSPMQPRIWST